MTHPRFRAGRLLAVAAVALLTLTGCGGVSGAGAGKPGGPHGEVTVFAAASLTESFREVGAAFERAHPGVTVRFSFAGSSALARQVVRGAPADVFASANPQQMRRAVRAGETAGEPRTFAHNRLQIAVPPDNPGHVRGLAAFAKSRLDLALCAEQVPCGAAARKALRVTGVRPKPDTLEQDVKAVLTKVRLGEVDAGLVYRTDVAAADGAVKGIDFPASAKAINDYEIAGLRSARNPEAARAFVDFVRSRRGQDVLADFGFGTTAG